MTDPATLSETIASTATIKLARIPESSYFCTPIEERFELITRLGKRALNTSVAAITFVNADRQWFKSVAGWAVSELPNNQSFCVFTLSAGRLTVIEDTLSDPRTASHPLTTTGPQFRFYAGIPLHDESNQAIGTLCVMDQRSRKFTRADRETMADLAALTQRELVSERLRTVHSQLTSKLGVARREAMMDPLTRLWNRRGASVMLKSACEESDRVGSPLAIALLDLDNFKRINDNYGHQTGDEVLRKAASRLVHNVRATDVVCRLGGDEFLVLMADTDAELAGTVAERIRRGVTETSVPTRQGGIPISVSAGFTVRTAKEPVSVEQLIERADRGLLRSKELGRNRVASAD